MKSFKFQISLVVAFRKDLNNDEKKYVTNYLSYQVMPIIQKWLCEGLLCLIESVDSH